MAKKSIQELLVDLRIADVQTKHTDQGDIVEIWFESMTSDMLGGVISIPQEVADDYDLTIG